MCQGLPATLYHYTTLEAACSIGATQSLWASDIKYLNDATEFNYGYELAREVGERLGLSLPTDVPYGLFNDFSDVSVYIVSLSSDGNLLSQWRAYCPDGGVSIGFGSRNLQAVAMQYGFTLAKCEYDKEAQWTSCESRQ